jgi:hypothetical protein
MDLHLLRIAFATPLPARVPVFSHQFLLLGVHRDRRLRLALACPHPPIDILELGVAVGMSRALLGLAVALQAIARPLEQGGYGALGDRVVFAGQLLRQVGRALAGPQQRRFGMAAGGRFEQRFQGLLKMRIDLNQGLASATRPADTSGHRFFGVGPSVLQFPRSGEHSVPCQSRRLRHGGDAAPTQFQGLGGGPLPTRPLVHQAGEQVILLPHPGYGLMGNDTRSIAEKRNTRNSYLLKLFFRYA